MIDFAIIDSTTGEVISTGRADDPDVLVDTGQEVIEEAAPANSYWDTVGLDWVTFPSQPSEAHIWDWATHAWVIDLAAYKNVKQDFLVMHRDTKLYAVNVQHNGTAGDGSQDLLFASNALERERIRNAAFEAFIIETRAAGTFTDRPFRDQFTNLDVDMDGPECIKLQQTIDDYTEAVWAEYYDVRTAIDVAATYTDAANALAAASWPDPTTGSW